VAGADVFPTEHGGRMAWSRALSRAGWPCKRLRCL
jgi:hypothetical protein